MAILEIEEKEFLMEILEKINTDYTITEELGQLFPMALLATRLNE